jgi:hypothetical protein
MLTCQANAHYLHTEPESSLSKQMDRPKLKKTHMQNCFCTPRSKQQQEESEHHAWPVVGVEHHEMHCATTEVGVKEVLTVTECCLLGTEQCFHEVINSDPDIG